MGIGAQAPKAPLHRQPAFWAALYFLVIPSFAFIYYTTLAHQFYASYDRREPEAQGDGAAVAAAIKAALLEAAARNFSESRQTLYATLADRLVVDDVDSGDGKTLSLRIILFNALDAPFAVPASNEFNMREIDQSYSVVRHRQNPSSDPLSQPYRVHWLISLAGDQPVAKIPVPYPGQPPSALSLLDILTEATVKGANSQISVLDLTTYDTFLMRKYLLGMNGDPSNLSDAYWRYFYFSAMIITTVGFGDIVPLTTAARLVVGFEAILGIAIAGMFINSVASKPT